MTSPLDTQQYWQQEDQKKRQREADFKARTVNRPWTSGVDYQSGWDQRNSVISNTSETGVQAAQTVAAKRVAAKQNLYAQQQAQKSQWASQDLQRSYQVAAWKQQQQALKMQKDLEAQVAAYGQQANAAAQRSGQNIAQPAGGGGTTVTFGNNQQYNQIAQWAKQAGWADADIPTVVSIAMAESSGSPTAVNNSNSNGSSDYGLMQINSVHGDLLKSGNWQDPVANLKMAKQVFDGQGWSAWTTYNNGSAAKFLQKPTVTAAPVQMGGQTVNTASGIRQTIIQTGMKAIGLPYVWGAADLSSGVDCSGLVQAVYAQAGVPIPQRSGGGGGRAQSEVTGLTMGGGNITGRVADISSLQPGDLIAWTHKWAGPDAVGHIAIYAGNNEIIEAAGDGIPVQRRPLRDSDYQWAMGLHLSLPGD